MEARERTVDSSIAKKSTRTSATSSLLAGGTKSERGPTYCEQDHPPDRCTGVTDIDGRKT